MDRAIKGPIRGLLFDKDGTLFDFQTSWAPPFARLVEELAAGDPGLAARLAEAAGFDAARGGFAPHSVVIAGTLREVADALAPHLPAQARGTLPARLDAWAQAARMRPVCELAALTRRLRGAGLRLGLATNDSEAAARAHLGPHADAFDFIAGYDSGHGAKPAPGMVLAFCRVAGLRPAEVAMVGDSLHDLAAARAAGAWALAVLTGVADRATLAPHADAVLDSVADLPRFLDLP